MKKKKPEEKIKIKASYKHRVPHKPTKVHRNKKKYTRKGKARDQREKELIEDGEKKCQTKRDGLVEDIACIEPVEMRVAR